MSPFRRIALASAGGGAGLTTIPMAAMAEGGLPQLDFANLLTSYQVLWGAVIFVLLYILARWTALPQVESVLRARATRIASDLDGARDARARAEAGEKAAAEATAKARAEAQAAINTALDTAKQAAAAQAAVLNERLDAQLKQAEGEISAARGAALSALPSVASDTAMALVARLTGVAPDAARLGAAIDAAMAARGLRS